MNAGYFDISKKYIDTAYATARNLFSYDTFQIDCHRAKLLLTQTTKDGVSPAAEREAFAQQLLEDVIARKHDDLYHPLSVMRLYIDIVQTWERELNEVQRLNLKKVLERAIDVFSRFSFTQKSRFRNIDNLKKLLQNSRERLS